MKNGTQHYSEQQPGATGTNPYARMAVATVLYILLMAIFIRAGFWQLDRAAEKEAMEVSFATGSGMELLNRPISDRDADESRYRRLELEGQYLPDQQILLDNIVNGGMNGYEVLTPFRTYNKTIMVNRGWVRANQDRRVLPDVSVNGETRTLTGIVNKFPAPGMRIAAEYPDDAPWPRRMLYPNQELISETLGQKVMSYQLLLVENQPDGYLRKWKALQVDPKTNYGYSFQWFSFALIATIFYVILTRRWLRERRQQLQKDLK
ncbi:MAG: SURF1 family protein [Gammaproteobacteria bacterium]